MKVTHTVIAVLLGAGTVYAETPVDQNQPQPKTSDQASTSKTSREPAEVMKLTQQAMTHIDAAARALQDGKSKAATSALARSEQVLRKIYKTPPATALLNEFDEIINGLTQKGPSTVPLDLQPLRATVSSYQRYVDPEVIAGIDTAEQQAQQGDMKASENTLRLARNRVAIDMAFLPVEEAYTRVLAAQQALRNGDTKTALSVIRNVPVVVGELQLSRPLLPIRVDLQAAAEAADSQQWGRAKSLLQRADQQVTKLTAIASTSDVRDDLKPIANDIQRLSRQAAAGPHPQAGQIREVVQKLRSVGEDANKTRTDSSRDQG